MGFGGFEIFGLWVCENICGVLMLCYDYGLFGWFVDYLLCVLLIVYLCLCFVGTSNVW